MAATDVTDACTHIGKRDLKLISRKTALAMLTGILDPANKRSRVKTVSKITTNKLFDSGLEQQFVEALRCMHAHPFAESDDARDAVPSSRTNSSIANPDIPSP